jgi:hypothetical protein
VSGSAGERSAVESGRGNPWDRDLGGFGLGGRNSRFLFGGRNPAEPRPGLNGHAPGEVNGRSAATGRPAAGRADGPDHAETRDENGRDDMNGRSGFPGVPTSGAGAVLPVSGPGAGSDEPSGRRSTPGPDSDDASGRLSFSGPGSDEPTGRRAFPGSESDTDDFSSGRRSAPEDDPRRAASGWASVPTSTHPIVGPTSSPPVSAPPTSGAPVSAAPVSGGPVFGASFGQPPAYAPGLPDPAAGPVSGVPAPRAAVSIPVPVAKPQSAEPAREEKPQVSISFGDLEAPAEHDSRTPSPRRSASLEDAEPARRGRRAAPDQAEDEPATEDGPLRPGDVAAGHIAFWDEDAVRHFRAAWHEVKAEFVDDPVTALTRAHDLLTDAVNELTEAMLAERDELDPLRGTGTPDTESMRMAMRGYREFLDRIMAL